MTAMSLRLSALLAAFILLPVSVQAADPPTGTTTGKSQMSVGFTPPEKKADGPRPWTREDLYRARRHQNDRNAKLPRCEQDRLLTDKTPCDNSVR
jgi:hypothetical protein